MTTRKRRLADWLARKAAWRIVRIVLKRWVAWWFWPLLWAARKVFRHYAKREVKRNG